MQLCQSINNEWEPRASWTSWVHRDKRHYNKINWLDTALNTALRMPMSHSNQLTARPRANCSCRGQVRRNQVGSRSKGAWIPPPPRRHQSACSSSHSTSPYAKHTPNNCAAQQQPTPPRLPGSRRNGETSVRHQDHLDPLECGDPLQTSEHILASCPKHRPLNGERGLNDLDHRTLDWLASTELKVIRQELYYARWHEGSSQSLALRGNRMAFGCVIVSLYRVGL